VGSAAGDVVGSIVVLVVVATVAQVSKKAVVDTVVEVVRIAATEVMIPSWYFVVAIVSADIANMDLVIVASFIPLLQRNTIHYQFSVYI